MKVLSFGSLNFDHTYDVDHFVLPKETMSSLNYSRGFGGKGLNQSIAMAKAGLEVYHAGKVNAEDGKTFEDYLKQFGINTEYLVKDPSIATGHAIIEVCNGENRIILYGGANQDISEKQVDETLEHFDKGDLLLIQNEINCLTYLILKASQKGMKIAFNVAPMDDKVNGYPMHLVDLVLVNEVEGAALAEVEADDIQAVIEALLKKFRGQEIVMTVGSKGAYYLHNGDIIHQEAYKVEAIDTTSAGDTFNGYFLASYLKDGDVKKAMDLAAKASSITVSRKGSSGSIPSIEELK